jgi:branched-chain amino acid transport system ATP-binding protein
VSVALLEAHGLHKRFGDHVVLEDITLAFEAGRLSGIVGPNGAGKTTCFNVLTGGVRPDRGRVVFDGEDITGLPPHAIARRGLARSFQLMNVFDEYSALENVLLAAPAVRARSFDMLHDLRRDAAAQDRAAAVLARVGLDGKAGTPAGRLSYGDRRALEIGLAVAAEPRLLFLDEPTSGLGADGTARLAELIQELRRVLTIVVIEHDMAFLFRLADRISVIHWGQVIAEGTPEALRADPWLARSGLGAAV